MEKAITYVGNSLAIVLDRTVCELMGIGFGSIVKLSFQGARLIVEHTGKMKQEPVRQRPRRSPLLRSRRRPERLADVRRPIYIPDLDDNGEIPVPRLVEQYPAMLRELMMEWGLDLEHINRIHHTPSARYMEAHRRMVMLPIESEPSNVLVARRVAYIYMELLDCTDWDRVITLAIDRYPLPAGAPPRGAAPQGDESSDRMSAGSGADAVTLPPSG